MPSDPNADRNDELTPDQRKARGFSQQFATAVELPFVMVGTIAVGGLIGFLLDRWLHTKPFLMLIFGALGFLGGVRDVLRRLPTK
jgi:ATP synthase protein I